MTDASWLILADDLTGAADSAVAFAARGVPTVVGWNGRRPQPGPSPCVFAYDGESRALSASAAAARRAQLLAAMLTPTTRLFVKIDSTLRGQPAAEIRATLKAVRALQGPALAIVAPAFPATGRTTLDGRVVVRGEPLERTELWRRDHSYPSADLSEVLATEGLAATRLPLAEIRAGQKALSRALAEAAGITICDAAEDEDLDRIAAAGMAADRPVVWIGAGGLTAALARATPAPAHTPLAVPNSRRGTLVVVGSPAGASRAAAAQLAQSGEIVHVLTKPGDLYLAENLAYSIDYIGNTLEGGQDVLINLSPEHPVDLSHGAALAKALAQQLKPLAPHVGALVVTGGETAAAVLSGFGVDGVRLADEIEPGVSVGLTLGEHSFPIVTKAGAFGDEAVLLRAVERLRRIKREGSVA